VESLLQDLRFGVRLACKTPLFTLVAIVSLTLGISANTTIFSVFNAVFLQTLPVHEPERLVAVFTTDAKNAGQFMNFLQTSYPNYEDYRDQNRMFSGLVAQILTPLNLSTQEEPERVFGAVVSGNYFEALGVNAAVGRVFLPEEDSVEGKYPVVVLSHQLWNRRFGGDLNLIGKGISLNRQNFTVVGVAPRAFRGTFALGGPDLYVPMAMHEQVLADFALQQFHQRRALMFQVFGRLKPGVGLEQARAAMKTIAQQLELSYPKDNQARNISLMPLLESLIDPNVRGDALLAGGMMMGVVGLVLLVACANVANLLLARAAVRQREVALRLSLGASKMRLVRQLLTESSIIAIVAGLLGLLLAAWGRDLLWLMRPPFLDANAIEIALDGRVLLFTAGITMLTGLLFGLVPAFQASRVDLMWALKERTGPLHRNRRRVNLRNLLVVVQIALSLTALVAAGLFLRSLQNAQKISLGFESQNLFMISFDLAGQKYDEARGRAFYQQVTGRVAAVPGVEAAGIASAPLFGGDIMRTVFVEGQDVTDVRNGRLTPLLRVSPGYFDAIGMPIKRGRAFNARDDHGAPMVVVVNETMARRLWPGEEALGKRFRCFGETWVIEVVGIAHDAKYRTLGEDPISFMYFPLLQHYTPGGTLHVRTKGNPDKVMGIVRGQVQAMEKAMPLVQVNTIGQVLDAVLWAPRMGARLLTTFGLLALLLAAIGIHGVMSYSVAQRTQEIGIRIALGARAKDVLQLILGQAFVILLAGGLLGLAGGLVVSRVVASLLYGVGGADPLSFVGTSMVLGTAALLASYLPARRALRVDPVETLRCQ
jgi:predicted permease